MDGWNTPWPQNGPQDPPAMTGEISTRSEAAVEAHGRNAERLPIALDAGLRQRGTTGVSVQIRDLSTHGFRIETHLELHPGADVWLRLPGLEASHATVAWVRNYVAGCKFERPLHPAVLDMIVKKARGR
jgi:hypothetical protein